eukprot:8066155-Pyramimonas_sp.AAC.1
MTACSSCQVSVQARWTMGESPVGRQAQGRPNGACEQGGLSCRGTSQTCLVDGGGPRGAAATAKAEPLGSGTGLQGPPSRAQRERP